MKPLYNNIDFKNAKSTDKLELLCYCCGNSFFQEKRWITQALNGEQKRAIKYCSKKCNGIAQKSKKSINCKNCNILFKKSPSQIKKSINNFCSRSCAASFNNKNKSSGIKRSKLEVWLEEQLRIEYPNLDFIFNDKESVGSELDIHIPSLQLAFELNGIFHYEPIFGQNKLNQIQENDQLKSKACIDNKIDLCVIDTSQQKYFKEKSSQKYLNIIIKIIKNR